MIIGEDMDIMSKPGTKVKFLNRNGWDHERDAANEILNIHDTYTVKYIRIGSWKSYVQLIEFPTSSFNTVMFENVGEYEVYADDEIDTGYV